MHLITWLNAQSGIAHSTDAARAGFTRYSIEAAVRAGAVQRVRRRWLATADAPADLRIAAGYGARLTCLSVASRHSLWHLPDGQTHLAVPPNAGHFAVGDHRAHWGGGPVGTPKYALVEPLENALVHVADCQPFENALVVWESAMNKGLVHPDYLAGLTLRSAAARRIRTASSSLSDSGIETIPRARLERIGIRMRQQVVLDGHPVDGLIGDRLVLQIDGFSYHGAPEQRRRDIAGDRRLTLRGYTVLRFDYKQILFEWATVEAEILAAMARGLHLADVRH
jgi:very-short-patch-repair endonuclease